MSELHSLTPTMLIAVRAYNRLMAMKANEDFYRAWECDRQFDGGEWSDAAWYKNLEEMENETATLVAERFGLEADDVVNAKYELDQLEGYLWLNFVVKEERHEQCRD